MAIESVDILIQRAQVLRNRNVNQAMSLLDDALSIAQQIGYKKGMADIIRDKGACYLIQKHYKLSLSSFSEAIHFYQSLGDRQGQLVCLNELSSIYFKLGDCPSALQYILQSLKINTELGDSEGIANNYNEIGKLYVFLQEYQNAIDHFKKGLRIFEGLKNKNQMVNSYFLLGNAYNWLDDRDKALYYLLRASNSIEQIDEIDTKAKTLSSLAILYTKLKEFDKAIIYFNEALNIAKDGVTPVVSAQIKKSLGNLYIKLTQYDKAIEVLNSALKIAENSPMEGQLSRIHYFLSKAYEQMGDSEKALYHYKKFYEFDKQVTSEEINLKSKALHIKYDLDELKKQKEIAELSDKLKEQFLANVSHEIRTPMNGVLGMAHLLSKTNPTKEQEEYIDAIKLSANNLMVIINDILDFSKINAGKIEFNENEFNFRDLMKGIIQILQVKADEKKIKLGCTIDYHIKDNLVGDPIRLNQILTNLMGNAVKFTESGKVILDVKLLDQKDNVCKIRMKVKDSGIGIPENKLQSIFDSFEQADNNKRRYEGTGLGLTIVKQLVELQGGTISVTSKINEGSEFIVDMTFKLGSNQKKNEGMLPVEEIEALNFSHVAVLIVEDNKVNQLLLKNMLKKFGFGNLDTAENGRIALNKLKDTDYDLILMDIQMPEMDGYEITKEIRKRLRKEVRNIPVIAISADASEKEKTKAGECGMNDYVVKPYTPEELYHTVLKFVKPDTNSAATEARKETVSNLLRNREAGMNLDFLEKFTGGDQELTIQLIEIFLKQVPEAIQKLNHSIAKKNWKETHATAHKLKSSISVFELSELKKLITNIEEYARDGENLETIPNAFSAFREGSRVVVRNLEAELRKLKLATLNGE
jgi:signal transduction histidine kinase/CheY-like chemotaxis protein/HPt (histidine-containing phosphotransfer) domain-containing protein